MYAATNAYIRCKYYQYSMTDIYTLVYQKYMLPVYMIYRSPSILPDLITRIYTTVIYYILPVLLVVDNAGIYSSSTSGKTDSAIYHYISRFVTFVAISAIIALWHP